MEGIEPYERVFKSDMRAIKQFAGFTDFAVFLFAASGDQGHGAARLTGVEGHDDATFAVADGLAVQREAAWKNARGGLQPIR